MVYAWHIPTDNPFRRTPEKFKLNTQKPFFIFSFFTTPNAVPVVHVIIANGYVPPPRLQNKRFVRSIKMKNYNSM